MAINLRSGLPHGRNCRLTRRRLLHMVVGLWMLPEFQTRADERPADFLPSEAAGVAIPHSPLAIRAASYARHQQPEFLFNHCMRTFGALFLARQQKHCNTETAFVAAAMHDLGLLPKFESPTLSFEIDGANVAEKFMLDSGASGEEADRVWHAVEMHDGKWALTSRQGPEAMLVSAGAGADVDGPDEGVEEKRIQEIVAAFPRLQFKTRFTALLVEHCKRKPTSQRATWLEGLCREQVPSAWIGTTEQEIAGSAFAE